MGCQFAAPQKTTFDDYGDERGMKRSKQATSGTGDSGLSGVMGDDIIAGQWERWQDSFLAPLFGTPETDTGSTDLAPSADLPETDADDALDGPLVSDALLSDVAFAGFFETEEKDAAGVTLSTEPTDSGAGDATDMPLSMTAMAGAAMDSVSMDGATMNDTTDHDTMDAGTMDAGSMDGSMDDGTMDHGSMDMGSTLKPPAVGATPEQIDAYVEALMAMTDGHPHPDDSGKMGEHMAAMDLVPRSEATHIAITDGDWFDTATWYNGEIPDAGAKVLIPEGIDVTYAGVEDASLFTIRVDGRLSFDTETDSRVVFDTMVVSTTGSLVIGTEADPVHDDVSIELIVANNGPIDTAWDPMLLSRGVIAHGEASIHGMEKDSHEKVTTDPMAGDTELSFAEIPDGWQVGDTIVIAGTNYDGHAWSNEEQATVPHPSEDEVRTIKAIEGNKVILDTALEHDHATPRDDLKTSVANMTRNVTFQTENGSDAEVYERGHVMFMHSDDVDVRYAAFKDLGRTDKSADSFDISDIQDVQYDSNVQGRYSLHLHRTGTGDIDNPVQVIGNAVWGSPGWGYVHHDSNAVMDNNASFDTFGAGFVAETGNETGAWNDNIAIYAEGMSWAISKNTTKISNDVFDTARGGDGFWFQGRLIETTNNVAASVNNGYVYFHRNGDDRMIENEVAHFELPEALMYKDIVAADDIPIRLFSNNETFASQRGLEIVKANPSQGHDVWSEIDSLTAWNVTSGVRLEYTSHYILRDLDLISRVQERENVAAKGISFGKNTSDVVVIDSSIDGFRTGIDFYKLWVSSPDQSPTHSFATIDTAVFNALYDYASFDSNQDKILTAADLPNLTPDLNLDLLRYDGSTLLITGTKQDALGEIDFPGGIDSIQMRSPEVARALEDGGYWTTTSGLTYFLLDIYFTDRVTGDIFYETHPVFIDETVVRKLGQPWWDYENAIDNGIQDFQDIGGLLVAGDHILDLAIEVDPVGRPDPAPLPQAGTAAADVLAGGTGNEILRGMAGEDDIQGGGGDDWLFGGRDDDTVWGQSGNDYLKGQGGNDKLYGGAGNDLMLGHNGQDRMFGGNGDDVMFGNIQRDRLVGHNGNDTLSGGFGRDILTGGDGNDIFHFDARHGKDLITDFTVGEDKLLLDYEGANFEDLEFRATNDGGTRIFTAHGTIELTGVTPEDLSVSDFMFTNGDYWA
jgi:Ca2+-binding RTX toxin-like protein